MFRIIFTTPDPSIHLPVIETGLMYSALDLIGDLSRLSKQINAPVSARMEYTEDFVDLLQAGGGQ